MLICISCPNLYQGSERYGYRYENKEQIIAFFDLRLFVAIIIRM